MKKYILLIVSAILVSYTSCSDDVEPGGTATQDIAGNWYVSLLDANEEDMLGEHMEIYTYNTSANTATELFIDDAGYLPQEYGVNITIKGKMAVDTEKLILSTSNFVHNYGLDADNDPIGYDFKILEGKILKGAGRAKSGRVTDSIYVKFEIAKDPGYGTVYTYTGHKKTGFMEDEWGSH